MPSTLTDITEPGTSRFLTIREDDKDLKLHYNDVGAGEETIVLRIQGTAQIGQAAPQDPIDQGALFGALADDVRLALLRMHVDLGACHVQIAAQNQGSCIRRERGGISLHRLEEAQLRGVVLPSVGNVDGGDGQSSGSN